MRNDGVDVSGDVPHEDHRGLLVAREARPVGDAHVVSAKYLQGHLNGYAWRYNHRDQGGEVPALRPCFSTGPPLLTSESGRGTFPAMLRTSRSTTARDRDRDVGTVRRALPVVVAHAVTADS